MARAIVLILDSVGIGGAPDAERFGDSGANTVGHIAEACRRGGADRSGRSGPLALPNLMRLGLGQACSLASGSIPYGLDGAPTNDAKFGCASEISRGKDTPSGHWELSGVPVEFDWGYFPRMDPCFPRDLIEELCRQADLPGILGNCHASGTDIIAELGLEHQRTGRPICYTSADSVFQIAAHEDAFGLDRLYDVCVVARRLVYPLRIGRVIARPFLGGDGQPYQRTGNRRDYSVPPPAPTILDIATAANRAVISVGKIGDIFAHSGTGLELKADGNEQLFDRTLEGMRQLPEGGLLLANFVDFDSLFGHRRDVAGYASALEAFDRRVPELAGILQVDDFLVITADHGCDPTWPGTDHTRERVPVLVITPRYTRLSIGTRTTFADIGASIAQHLTLNRPAAGTSFI